MSTWYIGPSGSDTTGDGTLGNPYATVGKCITVGADGDTIKALTGTYTITSTTNVTKQVTITSNSGVKTDVIFSSNCIIFNIQSNNVVISYITLQTSAVNELVSVDRMSTGSTVPTFWTGTNINNCNLKYVTTALTLNGTFTVSTNAFTRQSGSNTVMVMMVYSTRGACSISSNTFTDSGPVQYVIHLTSTGSGAYLDRCNSKGGTLTIASNTVTYSSSSQVTTFIFQDYFNLYSYGTVGADSQYNPNTRISLNVNNNNLTLAISGRLIYINTVSNSDYNTFSSCTINTNTVDNTDYGAVHLGKNTTSHSVVAINSTDLLRSVFKIYSNILNTIVPGKVLWYDGSDTSTLFQDTSCTVPIVDNALIAGITNKGSISNNLTNSSSNIYFKSNTVNSLGIIDMKSNGNLVFTNVNPPINASVGATLIVVYKTMGQATQIWCPYRPSGLNDLLFVNGAPSNTYDSFGYDQRRSWSTTTTINDSKPRIHTIVADAATGLTKAYVDSALTLKYTNTYSSSYLTTNVAPMGSNFSQEYYLCEWMVYDIPLTESTNPTLSSTISALATKWNTF
jgi:hypothetical protein